jgi:hypothetical protein
MNTKKGSKNAIDNRGETTIMMCSACGKERKPFRLLGNGKNQMAYECSCGILNKVGDKIM